MGSPLCIIWYPLWPKALNQAPFWGSIKFEPPMCSAFTDSVESTQQIGVGQSAWVEYPSGIDGFCSLYLHSPQILICSSNSNDWSAHWMGIIIESLTQFICKDLFCLFFVLGVTKFAHWCIITCLKSTKLQIFYFSWLKIYVHFSAVWHNSNWGIQFSIQYLS